MRAENAALREQALDRSRKLATVRFCVPLSQQYLNDHSGERQPVASESDVRNQWTQMLADLTAYRSDDGDAARFGQLREMVRKHWLILNRAMETSESQQALDDGEVRPLRVSALEITARVEDIDAKQTAATELTIQNQFERLGHGLGLALNFALERRFYWRWDAASTFSGSSARIIRATRRSWRHGGISNSSPRGWWTPRKMNAAPFPVNCTIRSDKR